MYTLMLFSHCMMPAVQKGFKSAAAICVLTSSVPLPSGSALTSLEKYSNNTSLMCYVCTDLLDHIDNINVWTHLNLFFRLNFMHCNTGYYVGKKDQTLYITIQGIMRVKKIELCTLQYWILIIMQVKNILSFF